MKYYILITILLIIVSFGCNSVTESETKNILSGTLMSGSSPLARIPVTIDERIQWSVETDSSGYFEIVGLPQGEHTLTAQKTFDDGSVTEINTSIEVTTEMTNLGDIILPLPPRLFPVDSTAVTDEVVPITWSQSYEIDFREYKVYRRDSPGLDETTGELIFVSTNRTDTSFVDNTFLAGQLLYYRVYILSAYGKVGGSNLVSIQTPAPNFIANGGFELTIDGVTPVDWNFEYNPDNGLAGQFSLDSMEVESGYYSLKATRNAEDVGDAHIGQVLSYTDLNVGNLYKVTLQAKSDGIARVGFTILGRINGDQVFLANSHTSNTEWMEISDSFRADDDMTHLGILLWIAKVDEGVGIGWFDNVRLSLDE